MAGTSELSTGERVAWDMPIEDDEAIEDFIEELLSQYEADRTFLQEGYSK